MNAQIPRDSRYYRPRRALSWGALIFGILAGLAGGLYWAWQVAPVEETDTAPWQLNAQSRANYVVAIMVNYGYDSDLGAAVSRLLDLRPPGDPVQYVADIACDLARSGYVDSASGERAIRTMMTFYRNQGRAGAVVLRRRGPVLAAHAGVHSSDGARGQRSAHGAGVRQPGGPSRQPDRPR